MERSYEALKRGQANAQKDVLDALEKDPRSCHSVYLAVKTHERLANKSKDADAAKKYFDKAKATYPYSAYFEGAKKDLK